ncbi:MAG: type II toxin-antitoxin system VapC family toxin [Pseudomonadota bacterium]
MNCVDSSGWIEFFLGSQAGLIYKPIIEQTALLIVPAISIYEVHRFLSRATPVASRDEYLELMCRSTVAELTVARAIAASEAAQKHRLAMADAIMYSIAREFGATFWTQDIDYQGLPGVNFFPRPQPSPLP